MEVNKINALNFKAYKGRNGKYYLSEEVKNNAQKLLHVMNSETCYRVNKENTYWYSDIVVGLDYENKRFIDKRFLIQPTEDTKEYKKDCGVRIGRNIVEFNSKTGEVVSYRKGVFTSIERVLDKTEDFINKLAKNINKDGSVQRKVFGIFGYTLKGAEILSKKCIKTRGI